MELHQQTPKTTVVAIISEFRGDNEFIMITKRKVDPYTNKWCLPGGHIENNETALDAIVREVKEETGLDYLCQFYNYFDEIIPSEQIHAVPLIFTGISRGEVITENNEVSDIKWIMLKEASKYDLAFQHNEILKSYKARNSCRPDENTILNELGYLRDEVIYRFETRNRMIYFAILLSGILIAFGKPEGFLLYPIIGTILAGLWSHSDIRIHEIGEYIKNQIELKIRGLNWEHYLYNKYHSFEKKEGKVQEKFVIWIFYSTYIIMFLFLAFNLFPVIRKSLDEHGIFDSKAWLGSIMLITGLLITFICMLLTRKYIKKRRKMLNE